MNIFEDLIEELKEENLLEETVIEVQRNKDKDRALNFRDDKSSAPDSSVTNSFENSQLVSDRPETGELSTQEKSASVFNGQQGDPGNYDTGDLFEKNLQDSDADSGSIEENSYQTDFSDENTIGSEKSIDQAEFYRKRATDEVNSLQMVEHVLSGVERDFLQVTPKLYDDFEVKKSLHNFLQFSHNINSPEQAHAEFTLMQETEGWYSALSQKDKNISVSDLRRYCETTRPALSSQALAALARFYRNAPFSDSVRSKFDLVMTRFFARETGGDIRTLIFSRDEIIEKLNEFYAEWSSIPLYATEEDESSIVIAAMRFEDFMTEAETAETFEELLKTKFFNRLKEFKENVHENFFAPLVMAAAIECNVRVGNCCVKLLLKAKGNLDLEKLEEKYGPLDDQKISETVCKTTQIDSIFEGKFTDADIIRESPIVTAQPTNQLKYEKQDLKNQPLKPDRLKTKTKKRAFPVNRWLLAVTIIAVLSSIGLYLYVEYISPPPKLSGNVKIVNLDNSSLKEYIQTARLSGDMFYGIVNGNWDNLDKEKKEDLLRKILQVGGEQGFVKVSLMDKQGKSVGFASPEKIEIYNP